MATSDLAELGDLLPFRPVKTATAPVYNPETQTNDFPESTPPEGYFIQAKITSRGAQAEAEGLERRQFPLTCRLVKTPEGTPLELPPGFDASYRFPLTFLGREGVAEPVPLPSTQMAEIRDELGPVFHAVWRFND